MTLTQWLKQYENGECRIRAVKIKNGTIFLLLDKDKWFSPRWYALPEEIKLEEWETRILSQKTQQQS